MAWTTALTSEDAKPAAGRVAEIGPLDQMRVAHGQFTIPAVVIGLLALSPLPLALPSGIAIVTIAALGVASLLVHRWLGRHGPLVVGS
jgi:hypothetical protein